MTIKMKKTNLPIAYTLVGTSHLPPISDQGWVNCCIAEAITYTQFSNAVSRLKNADEWSSAKNLHNRFSSKFTYDFSNTGPVGMYEFLRDHGCVTLDRCSYEKNPHGGWTAHIRDDAGDKPISIIKKAVAWAVNKDEMKTALKHRVKNHENFIHEYSPYNKQSKCKDNEKEWIGADKNLTSDELICKVKQALVGGNVVVSKAPYNAIFYKLQDDSGTYGKKGEPVVILSTKSFYSGNHASAIVGYDDNVTVKYAGVTLKGAFLMAFAYGENWERRDGYYWIMYDSIKYVSEHEILNAPRALCNKRYLTFKDKFVISTAAAVNFEGQDWTITKMGEVEYYGEVFDTYRIYNNTHGKYISYSNESEDDKILIGDAVNTHCTWAIIPYTTISQWIDFKVEYEQKYEGTYWICAVEKGSGDNTRRFLDAGVNVNSDSKEVNLVAFVNGQYPIAKCWDFDVEPNGNSFTTKIQAWCRERQPLGVRRTAMENVGFIYWDRDIIINKLPALMAEIELDAVEREGFSIALTRTDPNGNKVTKIPAMFANSHAKYILSDGDWLTFSGELNSTIPETGSFTLQYGELLELYDGMSISDYSWGMEITAKGRFPVTIRKLSLIDAEENVLVEIMPSNGKQMLENSTGNKNF